MINWSKIAKMIAPVETEQGEYIPEVEVTPKSVIDMPSKEDLFKSVQTKVAKEYLRGELKKSLSIYVLGEDAWNDTESFVNEWYKLSDLSIDAYKKLREDYPNAMVNYYGLSSTISDDRSVSVGCLINKITDDFLGEVNE